MIPPIWYPIPFAFSSWDGGLGSFLHDANELLDKTVQAFNAWQLLQKD